MDRAELGGRPAGLGAHLRLRVPPDPKMGRYVREQVMAFASALGIVDVELGDFVTAIGEAMANAMEHSGAHNPIEVSAWLVGPDRLVATVIDDGVGFTPKTGVDANLPDSLAERGRGLPIMRRCADEFSVTSTPGRGTTVTLGRNLRRRVDRTAVAGSAS